MKKKTWLRTLVLTLLSLLTLFLVVALFLPSKYHIKREIVMQAPPEKIFPFINNLKKWPQWSTWTVERDPTLTYSYEGPDEGKGAVSKWDGKKLGNGMMTILDSDETTGAKYDLSFEHGKFRSVSTISFEPNGNSTRVIWIDDGDLGSNPFYRYFGLFFDRMIGPDFEKGLARLKSKVETGS